MSVLVLPVSGGYFPYQVAALIEISRISELNPRLVLASSGGNVAAYLAEIANYQPNKILRISQEIHSGMFISKHSSIPTLDAMAVFYNGSLYTKSDLLLDKLKKYANQKLLTQREIWTGTFNRTSQRAQFYCNLSRQNASLSKYPINHTLYQTEESEYLNGSLPDIAQIILASASIPTYVLPQNRKNAELIDGGVAYSSPLAVFKNSLIRQNVQHIIYVNGMNLAEIEKAQNRNIIENGRLATIEMSKFNICKDRQVAYETVFGSQLVNYEDYPISSLSLIAQQISQGKYESTLLEIYPLYPQELNVVNFTSKDILDNIKGALLKIRFWAITAQN